MTELTASTKILNEELNYGGLLTKRIDIIRDLQAKGFEQRRIDFYLFCLDQNQERRRNE